jgi:hypothetical protein
MLVKLDDKITPNELFSMYLKSIVTNKELI